MNNKILNLNKMCAACSMGNLGTLMNTLYNDLNSTPAKRYDGTLLTESQINEMNNMCGVANKVSLGTIVAGLLTASKNGTIATAISDTYAAIINDMCPACFDVQLGTLIQELTIIVNSMAYNTGTDILTYTIENQVGETVFDRENNEISIEMPNDTSLDALTPSFTLSEGAIAKIGDVTQESGVTSVDFSSDSVEYTVLAEDGTTVATWTVTVTAE